MTRIAGTLTPQVLAAIGMIAVVHGLMLWLKIPSPQSWFLGTAIYAGLVAVLFSSWSLVDKLRMYAVFIVMVVTGALTICPCTRVHLLIAGLSGLAMLIGSEFLKRLVFGKNQNTAKIPSKQAT